ncbi:hypothetical protein ACB092_01G084700 [Castanea dentata]
MPHFLTHLKLSTLNSQDSQLNSSSLCLTTLTLFSARTSLLISPLYLALSTSLSLSSSSQAHFLCLSEYHARHAHASQTFFFPSHPHRSDLNSEVLDFSFLLSFLRTPFPVSPLKLTPFSKYPSLSLPASRRLKEQRKQAKPM